MKNKADNKKRNFLTHSEIESLLKAANTGPHAARNYCLTCFVLFMVSGRVKFVD
ncbi:outer membrane usher protein FimD [Escherichia coli]|uniref:Outer membrane usher protein FimD n=1 Tax=Escherichia coli TaxID=562 RepID=A0A376MR60_ECOLX|nr:outer membrane usher protein FimD [Escherichia coli]